MIQPNELRLLNWVKYDNRYFQIHSIAYIFPTLNTDEFGIGVVDYNNIQPVELTPDILEAAGFKKWGREDIPRTLSYEYNRLTIFPANKFCDFEGYGFVSYKPNIDESKESALFKFKYLHQLQNLYWCLCGEELQIDITKLNK